MNEIRIGTSGYSFQDWKGPFYPENIPDGAMLTFYAEHFSCTEVNSTYYRIPHPKVFEHMARKVPPTFEFVIKVHGDVTHVRKSPDTSMENLLKAIQPIVDDDKFSGFLAQFPYSFKNSLRGRRYLVHLSELTGGWPLFVEFRHVSWLNPALYDFLAGHRIGYVNVDEPQLPNLLPRQQVATTETAYVRFHGRNRAAWWNKSKGDRYDYLYSTSELEEWQKDMAGILDRIKKMYLFFNNCYHGQAPRNALDMKALFGD